MNEERSDELTTRERAAFDSLADSVAPPAECEQRIVDELRARGLVREGAAGAASRGSFAGSYRFAGSHWRRLLPAIPRVALATAALAGAFLLGARYGSRSEVAGSPGVPAAVVPDVESTEGGGQFKNADGEMVASAQGEPLGYHPGRPLELAGSGKPPIDPGSEFGYAEYPLYPLDGSPPSVSRRVP